MTGEKTDGREGTEKNFSIRILKNSLKGPGRMRNVGYKSTGDRFTKNSVPVLTGDMTDCQEGTEKKFQHTNFEK